jgi:selenide,water dikinase
VIEDPRVLLGIASLDDAGAYRLDDGRVIVQTVDFFTPIVDDAYSFGAIAAANAFSDIYAMGIEPMVALNIVAFPSKKLPESDFVDMVRGAMDKAAEARVAVVGGHSIDDPEPKMGMAVTSIAEPDDLVRTDTARCGDLLYLTKPLGTGIIATAIKQECAPPELVERAVHIMSELNRAAMLAMVEVGVDACTDVTGFGLLGHLREVMDASDKSAELYLERIPVLGEVWDLIHKGNVPGGTRNNLAWVDPVVTWGAGIDEGSKIILSDAQTSGGLLVFVPEGKRDQFETELRRRACSYGALIGRVVDRQPAVIHVERSS